MNEISVVVKQEPGKIFWNFEEIKKRLNEELKVYQSTAYTDDTIKTAKKDVADLRKLASTIEERRKEVKEQYLQPYNIIETQAKELVSLIDKPIQAIKNQVDDYEKRRREAARAEIIAYWLQKSVSLPEDIREKAKLLIYDERWENATATKKSWREGIEKGIQKILDEIATLQSFQSEFEEDALAVYKVDLSLQKAIRKMNELKAQKERILEMERRKKEQEEQEAQKRKEAEESQLAAEQAAKEQASAPASQPQESEKMKRTESPENWGGSAAFVPSRQKSGKMVHSEPVTRAYPGGAVVRLQIAGTQAQIKKIQDYIRFTGATYQEV